MEKNKVEVGSLEFTPTWTVAVACSFFVLASFALVRAIHYTGKWLRKRGEKSLRQALDKIKEELMLLGFISLLLTVFQPVVASICMPQDLIQHMLPCKLDTKKIIEESRNASAPTSEPVHSRRLLSTRRFLTSEGGAANSKCFRKGKVPFVSAEALHKLHIFIFVLAIVHVVYSCLTLVLGRYKVHAWHAWEKKAQSEELQAVLAPKKSSGPRLMKQTSFLRKHANPKWISSGFLSWIVCFFRQFGRSVTSTEYKTLRLGFISNHKLDNSFDFHRYVLRVLESDFKKVVGISAYLWVFVVVFLLLNVNGWHTYFWIAFLPLGLLLWIGAKLQRIIMQLAVEIAEEQKAQAGLVVVNLRDELFWFNRPKLILYLIHFILFQNAFEFAFFFWIWTSFGFDSCFMDNVGFVITRLVIGVIVQVLCSYSTLPVYALVTQMGKQYQFTEGVQEALMNLHGKAKKKSVHGGPGGGIKTPSNGGIKDSKNFKGLVNAAAAKQNQPEAELKPEPEPGAEVEMGTKS